MRDTKGPAKPPKKSPSKKSPSKKTELARATPQTVALDAAQRKLLAEALRLAEETRDVMEDALVSFGRWLLVQVFDNDASAALEGRRDNPVWRDLLARAGGPTLRLSEKLLYVALQIAAYDKSINDEAWRNLEPGRKQFLLPLGDKAVMRKAAQHVTAMKLTHRATHEYVTSLLAERGEERAVRVTAPKVTAQVRRFRERVTAAAYQRQALASMKALPKEELEKVKAEVTAVRDWADAFLGKIRRHGRA